MTTGNEYSERDLFRRLAIGEEEAFRIIFDLYRERLFAFAWQLSHSAVEAEEIVQDVFCKLWEQREKLSGVSTPQSYIYAMTRNRTLDTLAKIARNQQLVEELWINMTQTDNVSEGQVEAEDSRKLIDQAIRQLSTRKQEVFRLSRHEDLSHQQIAEQLHISVQTVKNIITEILRYLKIFLSQHTGVLSLILCGPFFTQV